MAQRLARGWLAILLIRISVKYRRGYTGRHRPETHAQVPHTYHPDTGVWAIQNSPYRRSELWLARFDGRDESEYLSAALMRAPVVRSIVDTATGARFFRNDFSALWLVIDYLKAQSMSNWEWLKCSTDEYPEIWTREMEILNGSALATV